MKQRSTHSCSKFPCTLTRHDDGDTSDGQPQHGKTAESNSMGRCLIHGVACTAALTSALQRSGPLDEDKVASQLLLPLLEALKCCHDQGTAHGGLHPANISFDSSDTAYLVDKVPSGTTACMCHYMAPEVRGAAATARLTPAVDIYACGVLSCEVLLGQPPQGLVGSSPDSLELPDTLSLEARSFIRHALCQDPHMRLTARQLLSHRWIAPHVPHSARPGRVCRTPTAPDLGTLLRLNNQPLREQLKQLRSGKISGVASGTSSGSLPLKPTTSRSRSSPLQSLAAALSMSSPLPRFNQTRGRSPPSADGAALLEDGLPVDMSSVLELDEVDSPPNGPGDACAARPASATAVDLPAEGLLRRPVSDTLPVGLGKSVTWLADRAAADFTLAIARERQSLSAAALADGHHGSASHGIDGTPAPGNGAPAVSRLRQEVQYKLRRMSCVTTQDSHTLCAGAAAAFFRRRPSLRADGSTLGGAQRSSTLPQRPASRASPTTLFPQLTVNSPSVNLPLPRGRSSSSALDAAADPPEACELQECSKDSGSGEELALSGTEGFESYFGAPSPAAAPSTASPCPPASLPSLSSKRAGWPVLWAAVSARHDALLSLLSLGKASSPRLRQGD